MYGLLKLRMRITAFKFFGIFGYRSKAKYHFVLIGMSPEHWIKKNMPNRYKYVMVYPVFRMPGMYRIDDLEHERYTTFSMCEKIKSKWEVIDIVCKRLDYSARRLK
jgi:hypothetical protein